MLKTIKLRCLAPAVAALVLLGCQVFTAEAKQAGGKTMHKLSVTSTALTEGAKVPKEYTGDGKDVSPPLSWGQLPTQAKSVCIICDDPDAPVGNWTHWVLFNIPVSSTGLSEGVRADETLPDGSVHGINSWKKVGYNGPAPPPGQNHRYFFKVYALDKKLDLKPKATRDQVLQAINGHVVAEGQLMSTYNR